jgi:hypothetical protein
MGYQLPEVWCAQQCGGLSVNASRNPTICNRRKLQVRLIFAHVKNFSSDSVDIVVKIPFLTAVYSPTTKKVAQGTAY